MAEREKRLIVEGSPCDTNFFDSTLLTVQQAKERGKDYCPMRETCKTENVMCALRYGWEVASYVAKGGTLAGELAEFGQAPFLKEGFRNSVNRRDFTIIENDKAAVLRAVEGFAKVVLLEDVHESQYSDCDKCGGAKLSKTVHDTVRDGHFPLSGSGRTQSRSVEYCPKCDGEPRGQAIDPEEDYEMDIIRKRLKEKEARK